MMLCFSHVLQKYLKGLRVTDWKSKVDARMVVFTKGCNYVKTVGGVTVLVLCTLIGDAFLFVPSLVYSIFHSTILKHIEFT